MSTDAQRYERLERIWALLASAAAKGDTVTYKQVGDEISLFHRNLQPYLLRIKRYCQDHKLPHLNAVCVAADTDLPSDPEYGTAKMRKPSKMRPWPMIGASGQRCPATSHWRGTGRGQGRRADRRPHR
jgi:hypothetical protein